MEQRPSASVNNVSNSFVNVSSLPVAMKINPSVRLPNFKGQKREDIDELLLQVLREENIPNSFLDNVFFKEFVSKLNKTYKLPQPQETTNSSHYVRSSNPSTALIRIQRRQPTILKKNCYTHQPIMMDDIQSEYSQPTYFQQPVKPVCPISQPSTSTASLKESPQMAKVSGQPLLGALLNNKNAQRRYDPVILASAVARYTKEVKAAIAAAEYVAMSAKCYRLCTGNKYVLGHLICVFVYTPQPYLVGQFKYTNGNEIISFQKRLSTFVDTFLNDIDRHKIVSLTTDHSEFCNVLALMMFERFKWIATNKDDMKSEKGMDTLPSSFLLPMMNPSEKPEFNEKALKVLSQVFMKHPTFRGSKLIVDWAHWIAKTGVFATENRPYAWSPETLNLMDAFTWWNGFFADTTIARLYSMLNVMNGARQKIRNSWTLVEQLIANETKQIKTLDLEETMKAVYVRYNRRDHAGRQTLFSPIEP